MPYAQLLRGTDTSAEVQPQVEEAMCWRLMDLLRCEPALVFANTWHLGGPHK